jgi:hypothetical protein
MVTLLSLLLAIDNRLIQLVVMAWHPQRDLASQKTKPLDGTVTLLANSSLTSVYAAPRERGYVVVVLYNQQFI